MVTGRPWCGDRGTRRSPPGLITQVTVAADGFSWHQPIAICSESLSVTGYPGCLLPFAFSLPCQRFDQMTVHTNPSSFIFVLSQIQH
jgi:hypothetical protein